MRVGRLGFATLKGTRHLERTLGDARRSTDRSATVPTVSSTRERGAGAAHGRAPVHSCWSRPADHDGELHLRLPDDQPLDGRPIDTRLLDDRLVEGRLDPTDEAAAHGRLLGTSGNRAACSTVRTRPRSRHTSGARCGWPRRGPVTVVWAGGVSLVTTGALERLTQRLRSRRDPGADRPRRTVPRQHHPRGCRTTRLRGRGCGSARPRSRSGGRIDRCAVVDIDPGTGRTGRAGPGPPRTPRRAAHLRRRSPRGPAPGWSCVGDPAAARARSALGSGHAVEHLHPGHARRHPAARQPVAARRARRRPWCRSRTAWPSTRTATPGSASG